MIYFDSKELYKGIGAVTGSKTHPYYVDFEGIANLAQACKESSKDPHLVVLSSIAVTRPWSFIHILLNVVAGNVMKWKVKGEEAIRQSGARFTIIRPGNSRDNYQ